MGVQYILVNNSKKEKVSFIHLPGSKPRELAGNPECAAVATWYLLHSIGDDVQFVSDSYGEWPFKEGTRADLDDFVDVTNTVVEQLIDSEILEDAGFLYLDEDEPEKVYVKKYVNIWRN